jgi:hydroxymethylbilane synthase
VKTTGDIILDVPLARIGDAASSPRSSTLLCSSGSADLAVHSFKDVPTRLPEGLAIAAVGSGRIRATFSSPARGFRDSSASCLRVHAIGTSSLRRRAQLRAVRPISRWWTSAATSTHGSRARLGAITRRSPRRRRRDPDRLEEPYLRILEPGLAAGRGAGSSRDRDPRRDTRAEERLRSLSAIRHRGLRNELSAPFSTASRAAVRCRSPPSPRSAVRALRLDGLVADLEGTRILRDQVATGPPAAAVELGRASPIGWWSVERPRSSTRSAGPPALRRCPPP